MVDPIKHDWPTLIREIIAGYGYRHKKRLSLYKLGVMVPDDEGEPTSRKMINRWLAGRSKPDHFRAELLLSLHAMFHREMGSS